MKSICSALEEVRQEDNVYPAYVYGPAVPPSARRDERAMEICEGMIDISAALFNISSKELRQGGRSASHISRVRQIAMYVTHTILRLSMKEVGRGFGRDRTTVVYACKTIEDLRDDPDFESVLAMTENIAIAAFRNRLEV